MASIPDILSPTEARKRLDELQVLSRNKLGSSEAAAKAGQLRNEILHVISIHGDQKTRALMAIFIESGKLI